MLDFNARTKIQEIIVPDCCIRETCIWEKDVVMIDPHKIDIIFL